jgi:transposase-like protein
MIQRKQRSKNQDEKKVPTAQELRQTTWGSIERIVALLLKLMFEILLDQAAGEQAGAGWYERTGNRKKYRNGTYPRNLTTRFGLIEDMLVPRFRQGGLLHSLFAPYQQRTDDVDKALGTLFLNGVSTHKLKSIAEQLTGRSVSAQTVSTIVQKTDQELQEYRTKPIEDKYDYLFLDGIYDKIREIGLERKVLLCALGMTKDGKKELLSFHLVDTESEANWTEFLIDLKNRGLKGKSLRLITSDGNPALKATLMRLFPYKRHQRCIWHKMTNVQAKTKKRNRKALMGECKMIFAAPSRHHAIHRFKAWKRCWDIEEPAAVKCLAKDLRECLSYYDFPKEHWKSIRTTNVLERSFREVRRRTRPMGGTFVNPASADRIYHNVFALLNNNWKNHPAAFTQNS